MSNSVPYICAMGFVCFFFYGLYLSDKDHPDVDKSVSIFSCILFGIIWPIVAFFATGSMLFDLFHPNKQG